MSGSGSGKPFWDAWTTDRIDVRSRNQRQTWKFGHQEPKNPKFEITVGKPLASESGHAWAWKIGDDKTFVSFLDETHTKDVRAGTTDVRQLKVDLGSFDCK